jgi:hypothetical protein
MFVPRPDARRSHETPLFDERDRASLEQTPSMAPTDRMSPLRSRWPATPTRFVLHGASPYGSGDE